MSILVADCCTLNLLNIWEHCEAYTRSCSSCLKDKLLPPNQHPEKSHLFWILRFKFPSCQENLQEPRKGPSFHFFQKSVVPPKKNTPGSLERDIPSHCSISNLQKKTSLPLKRAIYYHSSYWPGLSSYLYPSFWVTWPPSSQPTCIP